MLMRIWESENLIQLFLCGRIQKWPWLFSSWDPNTCFTLRVNLWIELIFWMLIVCNSFWLEWDPTLWLSLLFKYRGATAVVLLVFLGKRVDETKENHINKSWYFLTAKSHLFSLNSQKFKQSPRKSLIC